MAFMVPEYTQQEFAEVEVWDDAYHLYGKGRHDEFVVPADVVSGVTQDWDHAAVVKYIRSKWWARLSAPGYMDATDWYGPFDTLEEAKEYIRDTYDVHPITGEDLDSEEIAQDAFGGVKKKRRKKRTLPTRKKNPCAPCLLGLFNPSDPPDPNDDPNLSEYELPRLTLKEARDLVKFLNQRLKAKGSPVRLNIKLDRKKPRRGTVASHRIVMKDGDRQHDIGVFVSSKRRLFAHLHGFCRDGACREALDEVYQSRPQTFTGPTEPKRRKLPTRKKNPSAVISKYLRNV